MPLNRRRTWLSRLRQLNASEWQQQQQHQAKPQLLQLPKQVQTNVRLRSVDYGHRGSIAIFDTNVCFCLTDIADEKFDAAHFDSFDSKYAAAESVIDRMKRSRHVSSHLRRHCEFLYNEQTKTAILLKFVVSLSKSASTAKRNRRNKGPLDIAGRMTTTTVAKNAVVHFLNRPQFQRYDLVVPTGNRLNGAWAGVFLRKRDGHTEAIYFNPKWSARTYGPESNRASVQLMKMFGRNLTNVKAFDLNCYRHNRAAICWQAMFDHVVNGDTPFGNAALHFVDFTHFMTPTQYKQHQHKSSGREYVLKHYDMWKKVNDKLAEHNPDEHTLGEIIKSMYEIVYRFKARHEQTHE